MDEVLKAKRLTEEILKRAASIKSHMAEVNQRMANMTALENKSKNKLEASAVVSTRLTDLSPDLLHLIAEHVHDAKCLCSLAQTCKQFKEIVHQSTPCWKQQCQSAWGIYTDSPQTVPRMDTGIMKSVAKMTDRALAAVLEEDTRDPDVGNIWRAIYRDRIQGWHGIIQILIWLRDHDCPSGVSGSLHRFQLLLSLRYMDLITESPAGVTLKSKILDLNGLSSLLALVSNDCGPIQEASLTVLGNLILRDDDSRARLLVGSRSGRVFSDLLRYTAPPGVSRSASRVLVNLWADDGVPPVGPRDSITFRYPSPPLVDGRWWIQEFTMRGETMKRIPVDMSFNCTTGAVSARGEELMQGQMEEFEVTGWLDLDRGTLSLTRKFTHIPYTLLYSGNSDGCGAWGTYTPQRGSADAEAFLVSSVQAPRVFRLFPNDSILYGEPQEAGVCCEI